MYEKSLYTKKQEMDKAFHTLEGILKGIAIDNQINTEEMKSLRKWCDVNYTAFGEKNKIIREVITEIQSVLADNIITPEEHDNLLWLCNNITTQNIYYDAITADMQKLHGVLHGIMADGKITETELKNLQEWMSDNSDLMDVYPYKEIEGLILHVLQDGHISFEEHNLLKVYFSQFIDTKTTISNQGSETLKQTMTIPAICTPNPNIIFKDKKFVITGTSKAAGLNGKVPRSEIIKKIESKDGIYRNNISQETDYLIICGGKSNAWVFFSYGRKIEAAIQQNQTRQKNHIQIIKEVDFWDEVND